MNGSAGQDPLLPRDALAGVRIGISVSDSADLSRLGLLETHFRLALGEIARCVIVSSGTLSYAGHLDPSGYTAFLVRELQRYHQRNRPLRVSLAWSVHRSLSVDQIRDQQTAMGLMGQIECLDQSGNVMADPFANRAVAAAPITDAAVVRQGLTSMRQHVTNFCQARVLLGGRRVGFSGDMPGVVEEAILSLNAAKPIYLAAGFGGATLDIAKALRIDDCAWFPQNNAVPPDPRLEASLQRLADIANQHGWVGLKNGLSDDENRKLAATHRPSEIAALVSLGLGRAFSGPR